MGKSKSKLFKTKTEVKKGIQQSVLESVAAAVSGVASSFVYTEVKSKIPEKMKKYGGVGMIGIGATLNVFAKDSILKAAANGVATAGGVHVVNELASPKIKSKIGLPLGLKTNDKGGVGAIETEELKKITEDELAKIEAEMESEINNELSQENIVQGLNEEE